MQKLPDSELEVMQVIWEYDTPVSRDQINELLQEKHPIAQTTLLTLLTRLEKKGFISIEKQARISIYTPLIHEEEYIAKQSHSFFKHLCKGNISIFANALNDSGISKEDLEELRRLLERDE